MTAASGWTFLTNHGHVLVCLASTPTRGFVTSLRCVGITERAVQQIIRDLEESGYVLKERVGRRNRYTVVREGRFRHPLESGTSVGEFIDLVLAANAASTWSAGDRPGSAVRR